jgi:hypothetical protein
MARARQALFPRKTHLFIEPRARLEPAQEGASMIYILAIFVPPLALLLNGQPFAAVFNLAMIVPCIILGFFFPLLWLVPSAHAVVAIYMRREDRKHREIVDAIEKHGAPPEWRR